MTTLKKREANKRNATLSTGPTTAAGIAVSKMNALSHGLRAAAPVVPGEDPARWEQFRDGIVSDLAPVGVLETELADRVALLSWRLRRVASYEVGVVAAACEKAVLKVHFPNSLDRLLENDFDGKLGEMMAKTHRGAGTVRDQLASAEGEAATYTRRADLLGRWAELADADPLSGDEAADLLEAVAYQGPMRDEEHFDECDRDLMSAAGVPEEWWDEPTEWDGWTVGRVRAGMGHLASGNGDPLPERLARTAREAEKERGQWAAQAGRLRAELAGIEAGLAEREAEARRKVLIPTADQSDRVMKYEAHLSRQLAQALHELERRQALRSDCPPHPPAALDITVHAPDGVPALLGAGGG